MDRSLHLLRVSFNLFLHEKVTLSNHLGHSVSRTAYGKHQCPKRLLGRLFLTQRPYPECCPRNKKQYGAAIFEIIPEKNYPSNYQTLLDQAKAEINSGTHPAIKPLDSGIESYDTIYVGSPCWWGTIAPPVATFLSSYDFSGKVIAPFMTHEGSGMGHSEKDIRALCPKAVLLKGLPIRGSLSDQAATQIKEWLQESIYRQN